MRRKTERQQIVAALIRAGVPYANEEDNDLYVGGVVLTFDPDGRFYAFFTEAGFRYDRKERRRRRAVQNERSDGDGGEKS